MKKKLITFLIILSILINTNPALAASFNPNYIISDEDMFDYNSMTWPEIQAFLDNQDGILKNLKIENYEGKKMEASAIIYLASQEHKINPKILLAKLQHEASLITDKNPKDTRLTWAMGYAVCDSCSIWDPQVAVFGGFGQQVDYAARILRKYTDKANLYNYQVGDTYEFKDKVGNVNPPYNKKYIKTPVTFANTATKNLYTYTPHVYTYFYIDDETGETKYVGGNFNFWRIWNMWFGSSIYPDGSLLQIKNSDPTATASEKQVVWLIKSGKRRAFKSKSALVSGYDINKILYIDKKELDNYDSGVPIKYPNYSVLRNSNNTYLIVNDKKRLISSPEIFKKIGFNPEEVIDVEFTDLDLYQDGTPITQYSIYPTGALLQNNMTGGVYYVESSKKHPVVSKEILQTNFANKKIISVSPEELDKYLTGGPIKFNDGNLITTKGDPAVYVISNGKRRPISSAKVFNDLGYKWENIITTNQKSVEIHPLGDALGN